MPLTVAGEGASKGVIVVAAEFVLAPIDTPARARNLPKGERHA